MRKFEQLKLFVPAVSNIRFQLNVKEPFLLVYMSENSSFVEDYPSLNIRKIDFRNIIVPSTKIPRTLLTSEVRSKYKDLKLIPISSNASIPQGKNLIVDLSFYLDAIDKTFKPSTYRQRAGFLIKNIVANTFNSFPTKYRKILVYSIDLNKDFNKFINRKGFPLVQLIKEKEYTFDNFLLCTIDNGIPLYRLLIKDKNTNFQRILIYLRKLKSDEKEIETNTELATNELMKKVKPVISLKKEDEEKVKDAVKTFLAKDPDSLNKILSEPIDSKEASSLVSKAILYKNSGNINKATVSVDNIPDDKKESALKTISKKYVDELLPHKPIINTSDDEVVKTHNLQELLDNKSPEHLFTKRQIDFETNLKKDITNSFKVLEKKEIPLKVDKLEIIDKQPPPGELEKTDQSLVTITLTDKFNKSHKVTIEIPKIDPTSGTFRVSGRRQCLINQLSPTPITFPKPYESRFESSYSVFRITSLPVRNIRYLQLYMGSFKFPLFVILAYAFGFKETCNKYKIKYTISETKPKNVDFFQKLHDNTYIVFENSESEVVKSLLASLMKVKMSQFEESFLEKKFWDTVIYEDTRRVDTAFIINTTLENIIEPVTKQVLINMQLPSEIEDVIHYMSSKVVTGFTKKSTDLSTRRIRNSEIIVHLLQKQILAAYTEYSQQVMAGNDEATIKINPKKLISDFMTSQLVVDMEYANPIEELSTLTKVTPIGKGIGGIPDKRAVQLQSRNVHPSYFGNIDPNDTGEGGDSVGIIQYLSIGSLITSARGMISVKDYDQNEGAGLLSTSSAMVPFIECNDGARILMSTNQIKQALPLKNVNPPIVMSGYEAVLPNVLSGSFIKRAPFDGVITKITDSAIFIRGKDNKTFKIDITPEYLKSGTGKKTMSVFKPTVKVGQTIKQKDMIAEGACMSNGIISLGQTMCAAFMPYKGYNFEDGIVISNNVIEKESLISLHAVEEEILIDPEDKVLFVAETGNYLESGRPLLVKTIGKLDVMLGIDEEDETIEQIGNRLIKKCPGGKVVEIEVFANIPTDKFKLLDNLSMKTIQKYGKPTGRKFTVKGVPIEGILVRFKIEQELNAEISDKMCNRHGNKGIISLIEKDEYMPVTPWGDKIEIISNPLGVISRMNIGQIYELYTGLVSRHLGLRISNAAKRTDILQLLNSVLPVLDTSTNKTYSKGLLTQLQKLNTQQFDRMVSQIQSSGFYPLITPPFKGPKYDNIMKAMRILNLETGYYLNLPEFSTKTKNKVPVGYMYMYKLEHLGEMKIHARSTGPRTGKTMQPTAGKAKEGGLRVGEQDTHSLLSHNCPIILSELFGPMSDDLETQNEIVSDILENGNAKFRPTKSSPARDLLNIYMVSLMIER